LNGLKSRRELPEMKRSYSILLLFTLILAGVILSVQLPFGYYMEDNVFHAAKIAASKNHEYFTEPISGYGIVYPSMFFIINGNIARIFDLNPFQMSRLIQLFIFIGYVLSGWFFCNVILRNRQLATLCSLCLVFLIFAPTGKYFLVQNPYGFSIPFALAGFGLLLRWYQSKKLTHLVWGALLSGIAVNIWWYNMVPLAAIALGVTYGFVRQSELRQRLGGYIICASVLLVTISYNFVVLYVARDALGLHEGLLSSSALSNYQSTGSLIKEWSLNTLLRGNMQFFKYLIPDVPQSSSIPVVAYGLVASVYFYLIVLPFNWIMVFFSARYAMKSRSENGLPMILLIASIFIIVVSFFVLYSYNISVMRRIQMFAFVFLLPSFVRFMEHRVGDGLRERIMRVMASVGAASMVYFAAYSTELDLSRPTSPATEEVAGFIEDLPDWPRSRVFMTSLDVHFLCRYTAFRSFVINESSCAHIKRNRCDSLHSAYWSIKRLDENWQEAAERYDTKYGIIGKLEIRKYPIVRVPRDTGEGSLLWSFRENTTLVFENEEWAVFELKARHGMRGSFVTVDPGDRVDP